MWIDKLMVGMWKSMFCFKLNWDLNWKYESGWDWDYVDEEILRLSLKWRFESGWNCNCDCIWDWDCVWLNWNDKLVVNWIFDGWYLIIDGVIVDWIVWLDNELDYLLCG